MDSMTNLIAALVIGGATSSGVVLGDALGGGTNITLGEAVGVGVFACGIVYYIGRKLQSLEDGQKTLRTDIKNLPCHSGHNCMDILSRRLGRIEGQIGLKNFTDLKPKDEPSTT
jgi:hypothetical protein